MTRGEMKSLAASAAVMCDTRGGVGGVGVADMTTGRVMGIAVKHQRGDQRRTALRPRVVLRVLRWTSPAAQAWAAKDSAPSTTAALQQHPLRLDPV